MNQAATGLTESLHQFISTWKLLAKPFPQADVTDKPGLTITWANIPFVFYNTLFLTEQLSDAQTLKDRMQQARTYMRANQNPGWLVVSLDNLSGAAQEELTKIAEQEKFVPLPMVGMSGHILPLEVKPHAPLRFVRISDKATITDFADLNCMGYNLPIHTGRSLIHEHTFWHEHAYGFVAYEGDQPVSTATAIVNEDFLLLFLVATLPEARRKGYADAVIRHALNAAYEATGIRRTVLHASNDGAPVYLRMGYRPIGNFMGYLPAAEPETSENPA
ncbi:GNAT family N-acetyltransferase [Granulicella sp. dw_53]|uniref:GNAT family N-acetyltransferase n=1 Tax=Granulicella sp. dw_53 TaxID=2719792 RepID=UPI001BD502D6|nr:GNAT family N-acetyltransferase [Granulicella sp. dw_53]